MTPTKQSANVYISVCSKDRPEWSHVLHLNLAIQQAAQHGILCTMAPTVGEGTVWRARQDVLVEYMKTKCTHLFSVDDDIDVPANAIVKLVEADKEIIAGLYRLKSLSYYATAVRLEDNSEINWRAKLKERQVEKAVYVSTGCMMVKREVFADLVNRYPELHYTRNVTGDPAWALYMPYIKDWECLSEDWAFCQRALDQGYEIFVHCDIQCAHWMRHRLEFDIDE